jgi:hypothetical protein
VRLVMMSLVLVMAVGCSHASASASGPGYNAKRERSLFMEAQPALNCDPGSMKTTFLGTPERNYHSYRVDGCGQAYFSLLHCTGPTCSWIEGAESRAAKDLQCPATQLVSTYSNRIFTVTGCGKQATFQLDHGHVVPLQGGAVPMAPPPPPPP